MYDLLEEFFTLQRRNTFIHPIGATESHTFRDYMGYDGIEIPKVSFQKCKKVYSHILLVAKEEIIFSCCDNIKQSSVKSLGMQFKLTNIRTQRMKDQKKKIKEITIHEYFNQYISNGWFGMLYVMGEVKDKQNEVVSFKEAQKRNPCNRQFWEKLIDARKEEKI